MKLRPLVLGVAVLVIAAAIVHFATRPRSPAPSDPRVGEPLLDPALVERASILRVSGSGRTVELSRGPDGDWQVKSYHGLPADFAKLSRFVTDLTEATVERVVTSNPERMERLEFGDAGIALLDADEGQLWTVTLGRTTEGGGRFVRFDKGDTAYLSRLTAWLDTEPKNWADASLLDLDPATVSRVTLAFPAAEPVIATRAQAGAAFTAEAPPSGQALKSSAISSLVASLSSLRFTDTRAKDDPDAAAARDHSREVTLETFDGRTIIVSLGRRPAPSSAVAADGSAAESGSGAPEESAPGPATATPSPGPVFALVSTSAPDDPVNSMMEQRSFQVGEYVFNSLPKIPDELFEPAAVESVK